MLLGRKAMTNLGTMLKSRDITLSAKVHTVKVMVFPVVMYRYESWTIKKAERRRTNAFTLWCWWRLLRVPWTARRSSQSIIKEINPEYSLEGLLLKFQVPILWPFDVKSHFIRKDPGNDWRQKGKKVAEEEMVRQYHQLNGSKSEPILRDLSKFWEIAESRGRWSAAVQGVTKSQTWLSNWTITIT